MDPGSFRQAGTGIGRKTEDADTALGAFQRELDSYGQPWGNDDLGSLIGMSYLGIYDAAMDCFVSNLDLIDTYAKGLSQAADGYEQTDRDSADRQNRILSNRPNLAL